MDSVRAKIKAVQALRPSGLRSHALRVALLNLLDGAEDHRRGPLNGPAHCVPGAVAMMDLGEASVDGTGSPSGLVLMSQ